MSFVTFSRKLSSLPYLEEFLGHRVNHLHLGQLLRLRQTLGIPAVDDASPGFV